MHGRPPGSIIYRGRSMAPLFQEGDEVLFRPYDDCNRIRRGDVVVFSQPAEAGLIVHRVARADRRGIRTRGDNNASPDPWLLNPDRILGRVVSIRQGRKRIAVRGGIPAEWSFRIMRRCRNLQTGIIRALDPLWDSRFFHGFLSGLLPQDHRPRILVFNRTHQKEFVLLVGGRIVGRRFAGNDSWHIRRRARPFIEIEKLKQVNSEK